MLGSANKLKTSRVIEISGVVSGTSAFDGSKNITINTTQNFMTVVNGNITGNDSATLSGTLSYPTGYNKSNCIVASYAIKRSNTQDWYFGSAFNSQNLFGSMALNIVLSDSDIKINVRNITLTDGVDPTISNITGTYNIKIVLMKIA